MSSHANSYGKIYQSQRPVLVQSRGSTRGTLAPVYSAVVYSRESSRDSRDSRSSSDTRYSSSGTSGGYYTSSQGNYNGSYQQRYRVPDNDRRYIDSSIRYDDRGSRSVEVINHGKARYQSEEDRSKASSMTYHSASSRHSHREHRSHR